MSADLEATPKATSQGTAAAGSTPIEPDAIDQQEASQAAELTAATRAPRLSGARIWALTWPKLLAVAIALAIWQGVVLAGWKPPYVLPPPADVWTQLKADMGTTEFWSALATTLRRAVTGFALALLIGSVIGVAVARFRVLRAGVGSLITGLQTMPSIAWFPLAVLLFGLSEQAILFVVVLGAGPSVANGIISGIDHIQPQLLRVAGTLGAKGLRLYRYIVIPAALPSYVTGLKQGWAFAWRSLMAGELIVNIAHRPSLGATLSNARDQSDAAQLVATMIVILIVGMVVDALFTAADTRMRRRRGLLIDR
jgi:NitT/TauT family transport system permease protein